MLQPDHTSRPNPAAGAKNDDDDHPEGVTVGSRSGMTILADLRRYLRKLEAWAELKTHAEAQPPQTATDVDAANAAIANSMMKAVSSMLADASVTVPRAMLDLIWHRRASLAISTSDWATWGGLVALSDAHWWDLPKDRAGDR